VATGWITGHFLAPVDYGKMVGLALPGEFHISSAFLFEVSIFLTVLGSASRMIDALAYPEEYAQIQAEGRQDGMVDEE
jgi:hypothetical protein